MLYIEKWRKGSAGFENFKYFLSKKNLLTRKKLIYSAKSSTELISIEIFGPNLLIYCAPIEGIQRLMGHEKCKSTKIYAKLSGHLRKEFY